MALEREYELLDDYLANRLHGAERDAFEKQLENNSDMTLEQHQKLWFETQEQLLSTATISRMIKRLGWTLKKNDSRHGTQRGFTPNVA